MIKLKKEKISSISILIGLILLIILIPLFQKPSLATIFLVLVAIYLVISGIFNHKAILSIFLGIGLLITLLIWTSIQITSFIEIIILIISSILCIILGILAHLGYISKTWI
ncbi:MAG: hypothetical protein LLF83_11530 [Methanobacterium sp.]|nr:hypothetical protein [Methanobacterium sp.]